MRREWGNPPLCRGLTLPPKISVLQPVFPCASCPPCHPLTLLCPFLRLDPGHQTCRQQALAPLSLLGIAPMAPIRIAPVLVACDERTSFITWGWGWQERFSFDVIGFLESITELSNSRFSCSQECSFYLNHILQSNNPIYVVYYKLKVSYLCSGFL